MTDPRDEELRRAVLEGSDNELGRVMRTVLPPPERELGARWRIRLGLATGLTTVAILAFVVAPSGTSPADEGLELAQALALYAETQEEVENWLSTEPSNIDVSDDDEKEEEP